MSKWEEKRLEDIIDVNPPVKLKKGESYPFIDIDKVSPTRRSVTNEEVKVYDGQSSSKFCDGDTVFIDGFYLRGIGIDEKDFVLSGEITAIQAPHGPCAKNRDLHIKNPPKEQAEMQLEAA